MVRPAHLGRGARMDVARPPQGAAYRGGAWRRSGGGTGERAGRRRAGCGCAGCRKRYAARGVCSANGHDAVPAAAAVDEQSMSTVWRLMAQRTTQSWTTTPHFFLMRELDATAFKQWFAQAEKRATEKLTYTDLLVKVVATALRLHPRLNASWQHGAIVAHDEVNIALAVATADGLVAPVIPHADDLSLSGIARRRAERWHGRRRGSRHLTTFRAAHLLSATWACTVWMPSRRSSIAHRRRFWRLDAGGPSDSGR